LACERSLINPSACKKKRYGGKGSSRLIPLKEQIFQSPVN
jgi:hypothetical protein